MALRWYLIIGLIALLAAIGTACDEPETTPTDALLH